VVPQISTSNERIKEQIKLFSSEFVSNKSDKVVIFEILIDVFILKKKKLKKIDHS
jgi:hypothetical protein